MKNILIPIDFSDCSLNAVKLAAEIAKLTDATLNLAHINQTSLYNIGLSEINIEQQEQQHYNEEMIKLMQMEFLKGINVLCSFDTVYLLADVLVMNKYENINLVIMGSHGVEGIKEFFIGTNTEKFVQLADCPVIVIKNEVKLSSIKTILFASDFKEEVINKFNVFTKFCHLIGAKMKFVKIITPNDYIDEKKTTDEIGFFIQSTGIDGEKIKFYKAVTIERGIIKYAEEINADMIAVETHGNTGLSHLLNKNIAEGLTRHAAIPLLSVKMQNKTVNISQKIVDFIEEKNLLNKKMGYD
ncbi:MAG: universal stress protein [Flavobacteriales bacterium]|nr:universal stress protein [Flavobacteriales bacterium]